MSPARPRRFTATSTRGVALIDLVAVTAVIAIVSATAVPLVGALRDRDRARLAARVLTARLQVLRLEALRRNTAVALRFDTDDPDRMRAYVDGDGDGVLGIDITLGIDEPIGVEGGLSDVAAGVRFRIAADVPSPDDGAALAGGSDPVRLGASNMVSFSPFGTSSSGSLFLASDDGFQMCVRILGTTGRIRSLWFDRVQRRWRAL